MSVAGKDGLARNLAKLRAEWIVVCIALAVHWQRAKRAPDSHAYVNLWVEAARASPYLIGHVNAVFYPLAVVAITCLSIW